MNIKSRIIEAIAEVWTHEIREDISKCYILYEAGLIGRFYYHLSNKLKDFLDKENIRIYLRYTLDDEFSIDMVIAKLENNTLEAGEKLKEKVKEILFIFEFRHSKHKIFKLHDFNKIKMINKNLENYEKYKINEDTYFINCFETDEKYSENDDDSFIKNFERDKNFKNINYIELALWQNDNCQYITKVFDKF